MSAYRPHPACIDPSQLLRDCTERRARGSGPGGQHRNKTETAVELTHTPTSVTGAAGERRSLADNRRNALFRLRVNLALQVRAAREPGAAPSEMWRSRCKGGKIAINPKHEDFPAMLAEAMDAIELTRFDTTKAAALLGCSHSQLIKLLKVEPRALLSVNESRSQAGLKALH